MYREKIKKGGKDTERYFCERNKANSYFKIKVILEDSE